MPTMAFAETSDSAASSDALKAWREADENASASTYNPYSYASEDVGAKEVTTELPESYDLRDLGVVTPVKLQNPWGTCWGFAAIAASETSILSELGKTYVETGLDLSERQLAYFTYSSNPNKADSQYGEGVTFKTADGSDQNLGFNFGGYATSAVALFATGTGPITEEDAPYRNEEGIIECTVVLPGSLAPISLTLTEDEIAEYESQGAVVTKVDYAATKNTVDLTTGNVESSEPTNWSVSEDLWDLTYYELENGNRLPEYRVLDAEGNYVETDMTAVAVTKSEIMAGRTVFVAYFADQSLPGLVADDGYMDVKTWSQYTYETKAASHAVCVVGWDDNYSKENFGGGDTSKQPPADGAWIVKNSWGASTEDFPNNGNWGIKDEGGNSTGYFYMSYYDQSICLPETFDYDVDGVSSDQYLLYQYDYLNTALPAVTLSSDKPTYEANVYEADTDALVRVLACQTTRPNTQVTYQVYILDSSAKDPTDGELAYETTTTYEYGGYHREDLDESEWISVAGDKKFSVVVSQLCTDNNMYYQSVTRAGVNEAEEDIKKDEQTFRDQFTKQIYDMTYKLFKGIYTGDKDTLDQIGSMFGTANTEATVEEEPLSEEEQAEIEAEEAAAAAVTPMSAEEIEEKCTEFAQQAVEKEDSKKKIEAMVDNYMEPHRTVEYHGVVNAGESYTYTVSDSGEGTWTDWSEITTQLEADSEGNAYNGYTYDNFPIKAYAELNEEAIVGNTMKNIAAGAAIVVCVIAAIIVCVVMQKRGDKAAATEGASNEEPKA